MAARRKDRIIALFFAGIFIISISSLTVAIVLDNIQRSKRDDATSQQTNPQGENMLQGKQLEDFTPVSSVTELQIIDTTPGTGAEVKKGDTVTVDYTGAVASTGIIFQSSKDFGQTASFPVQEPSATQEGVIKGWADGVPGMKIGGTRRLIIPAALAYGGNPPPGSNIPVNADLVFDITLHSIGQ